MIEVVRAKTITVWVVVLISGLVFISKFRGDKIFGDFAKSFISQPY